MGEGEGGRKEGREGGCYYTSIEVERLSLKVKFIQFGDFTTSVYLVPGLAALKEAITSVLIL